MKPQLNIQFEKCNFADLQHCADFLKLLKAYMTDPMGDSKPLGNEKEKDLIHGLSSHPSSFVVFASVEAQRVAMATCFINFSTFKVKPYTNIHDIIVLSEYRGLGIGKALLEEIIRMAEEQGHCKVNLEVRDDNIVAQKLYNQLGFADCEPPMWFWTKCL